MFEPPEFWTIEALAQLYVGQLRLRQPLGPYRLAGWSLGGVVAFEMARILEQQGESVDFLGLIDSYFALRDRKVNADVVPKNSGVSARMSPIAAMTSISRPLGEQLRGIRRTAP